MNQLGVYAGGALLTLVLGLMVWMWWKGRRSGLDAQALTEADHAQRANQVREDVRGLPDADLDRELFGKR